MKNAQESLLGLRDGEALGIIQINPNGEIVRQATVNDPRIKEIVSGDETIDKNMDNMVNGFKEVFKGIGRATKVPPLEIEVDSSITPMQQKLLISIKLSTSSQRQKSLQICSSSIPHGVFTS